MNEGDVMAVTKNGIVKLSDLKMKVYKTSQNGDRDLCRYIDESETVEYPMKEYKKVAFKQRELTLGKNNYVEKGYEVKEGETIHGNYKNCPDISGWRFAHPTPNNRQKIQSAFLNKVAKDNNIEFDNENYNEIFYDIETFDDEQSFSGVPEYSRPTSHVGIIQIQTRKIERKRITHREDGSEIPEKEQKSKVEESNNQTIILTLKRYQQSVEEIRSQLDDKIQFEYILTEQEMCQRYFQILNEQKGLTYVCGFNSNSSLVHAKNDNSDKMYGYDLPFLWSRAGYGTIKGNTFFCDVKNTGRKYNVYTSVSNNELLCHCIFLDYQVLLPSTFPPNALKTEHKLTLNVYAKKILGQTKGDISIVSLMKFLRNPDEQTAQVKLDVYKYALQDVELLRQLSDETDILGLQYETAKMYGLCNAITLQESDKTATYWGIFYKHLEQKILLPYNSDKRERIGNDGAYNFQPAWEESMGCKFYEGVAAYDVSSMYPSHGIACNIGHDTFHSITNDPLVHPDLNSFFVDDKTQGKFYINIYKPEVKKSVLASIWESLLSIKNAAKKHGQVVIEKAVKLQANSIYGMLNAPGI